MPTIITVGKLKNRAYEGACQEYLKRLSRYTRITVDGAKDRCAGKEGKQMREKNMRHFHYKIVLNQIFNN